MTALIIAYALIALASVRPIARHDYQNCHCGDKWFHIAFSLIVICPFWPLYFGWTGAKKLSAKFQDKDGRAMADRIMGL